MTGLTARLAAHVAGTAFHDLPLPVVAAAKQSIFDTVGVMLAGSGPDSAPARFLPVLRAWGGTPEASVIGHDLRLPAPQAALANGSMGHQFDFDDTHDAAVVHPSSATLPAALAVAESLGNCHGSELLRAMALGNDVACRLGLAVPGHYTKYSFLRGPVIGIWGATAAAAALLRLTPEQVEWAFGHALQQTSVTLACLDSGSDFRGFRDGLVARSAVTAAWMAKVGVRGDGGALEGPFGLFEAFFKGEYRPEAVSQELGERFEGANVSFKPWPSSREGHAALRAVLDLRSRHGFRAEDVRSVMLHVGPAQVKYCEPLAHRRRPASRNDALQSLPFGVAVALQHGSVPLRAYSQQGLGDAAVLDVARRVSHRPDTSQTGDWTREPTRVDIELVDGTTFSEAGAPGYGSPSDPLTPAHFHDKFRDCASAGTRPWSQARVAGLLRVVDTLEERPVKELSAALGQEG